MAKWIPAIATFGLICVMVLPAPGIWGVLIGAICIVAIVISALIWALDQMSSRILARYARWRRRRSPLSRRAIHARPVTAKTVAPRKLAGKRA